ncbi:hypothetical protein ALC62_08669, partial [Cyphomyrmex costatus]
TLPRKLMMRIIQSLRAILRERRSPMLSTPRELALFSFPFSVLIQCNSLPMGVAIPYPLVSNRPPICVRLQSLWTI